MNEARRIENLHEWSGNGDTGNNAALIGWFGEEADDFIQVVNWKEPEEQRRSIAAAVPLQKPHTALADLAAPVGAGQAPALAEVPLPCERQRSGNPSLSFEGTFDLARSSRPVKGI